MALHLTLDFPQDKIDLGCGRINHIRINFLQEEKMVLTICVKYGGMVDFRNEKKVNVMLLIQGIDSTSISAGLKKGMRQEKLKGEKQCRFSDRRWSNDRGMAFEALNNASKI